MSTTVRSQNEQEEEFSSAIAGAARIGSQFLRFGRKASAKSKDATPESDLLRRFAEGDDVAFRELYGRHTPKLYRYVFALIHDSSSSEDIVQAAWIRIIEMRGRAREIRILPALLFRIARNLTRDYLRHAKPLVQYESLLESEHPVTTNAERTSEEEIVLRALETLPLETREILVLHYESGYSFEEIAALLDKRPNAIWTRVSRARLALKKIVERELRAEQQL